ncbi:hypothetical protein LO772_13350 [Yinghuangia sp. ASG 101]|uniref:hypothetical protein n=1 Tax=Yinghuangia sp. ASG 101 TaxID=2896848 RepID=UPI001E2A1801|nr:hypothetical protein [Yinghuangia sp. ASG 101]UGQ14480.1 hypothetical protein LO772_13350 [Yinghuangia sp. ASG 101]
MSTQGSWQRDVFADLGGVPDPAAPEAGPEPEPGPEAAVPAQFGAERPAARRDSGRRTAHRPDTAPDSVPVGAPDLDDALGRVRRGDPPLRRVLRAVRALGASAAQDGASRAETARAIQQPVTTGRQIAVGSIRGGAGKSTVAALLALTFAHYRADPVLAVEADGVLGTLPVRLGAREVRWSCTEIADVIDASTPLASVTGYLVPFPGGWLLPGSRGTVTRNRLDPKAYYMAMASLRRHFGVTVVDCETLPTDVARYALSATQARVLTAPATVEGVAGTRLILDWLDTLDPAMLPTTVVALVHTSPDMAVDIGKAARHLEVRGATVIPVPYDRSLAAGGPIRTARLARATRDAAARLAAATMDRAVAHGRGDAVERSEASA